MFDWCYCHANRWLQTDVKWRRSCSRESASNHRIFVDSTAESQRIWLSMHLQNTPTVYCVVVCRVDDDDLRRSCLCHGALLLYFTFIFIAKCITNQNTPLRGRAWCIDVVIEAWLRKTYTTNNIKPIYYPFRESEGVWRLCYDVTAVCRMAKFTQI